MSEPARSPKSRIVLRPEVTREQVEDAALDLDWLFLQNWPRGEDRPYEDVWVDRDERTWIHYVEDHLVEARYLVVKGADVPAVESEARELLAAYRPEDALRAWDSATTADERVEAVHLLALTADPEDRSGSVAKLRAAASDDVTAVRRALVLVTTYVGWPELRQLLEDMTSNDPVEAVRQEARLALDGLGYQDSLER
ncbi:HEAT repeat domain-containing protein [Amycolatopsis sp. lyj-23]|uniref:HEAT repeat domain-containing protein n=1 Tax=Amycolatopsis sp. lyj-23 TaxID=2789283 RepID=UPI00397D178A